jgi:hypothetical protein
LVIAVDSTLPVSTTSEILNNKYIKNISLRIFIIKIKRLFHKRFFVLVAIVVVLDVVQKCYQMDWLDRDIEREQLDGAGDLVMMGTDKETNGLASPFVVETLDVTQ